MTYWHDPLTHPRPEGHSVPQVPQLLLSLVRSEHVPAQFDVPFGQVHWLFSQTRLPPHASKQSPQLALFEVRSTQAPPHCERPLAAHLTAHVPALQMGAVSGQAMPHPPQFALFDVVSTQVITPRRPVGHPTYPGEQAQVPSMHGPPAGQTVPQAPQLRLLFRTLTQTLPHIVWPAPVLQPATQAPAVHIWPAGHAIPHPPQLRGSICVSEHVVPQSASFAPQTHWLATQLAPEGHGVLQAPQLSGSLVRSTQEVPQVARPPPPSAVPPSAVAHVSAHVPCAQTSPAGHTTPQPPQLFASLCVRTQLPLHLAPPLAHWHEPPWQVVPAPHTVSQPPQLELSVCSSTQEPPHAKRPPPQVHLPATQGTEPHEVPHEPQLFGSLVSSTQEPPQIERFGAHCNWQAPATHAAPCEQVTPHEPQLVGSEEVSTHAPEQRAGCTQVVHAQAP